MIIAFEGLIRVGKSSTISKLGGAQDDIVIVPEVMPHDQIVRQPASNQNVLSDYFVRNDYAKSELLAQMSGTQVAILDRYFVSTIAYGVTANTNEILTTEYISEVIARSYSNIVLPDFWVFIEEQAGVSWSRGKEQGCLDDRWKSPSFMTRIALAFDFIFLSMEQLCPSTKVVRVDSRTIVGSNKPAQLLAELGIPLVRSIKPSSCSTADR